VGGGYFCLDVRRGFLEVGSLETDNFGRSMPRPSGVFRSRIQLSSEQAKVLSKIAREAGVTMHQYVERRLKETIIADIAHKKHKP
jgi:hypothetical protein